MGDYVTDEEVRRALETLDRKIVLARELAEAAREAAAALQGKPLANANRIHGRRIASTPLTAGQIYSWNASLKRLEPASSAEPAAHVLATTTALGTKHTVSGLTARQVLIATGAATALFRALQDSDIPTTLSLTTAASLTSVGALASGSLAAGFTDVPVAQGGTGVSTLADHGVLLGSGAAAVSVVSPVAGPSATAGFQYLRSPSAAADAAYKEVLRTFTHTIEDPAADDDVAITFFFQAITIREIECAIVGTSCTIDPYHNPARNGGGGATDILNAATAITAVTSYNIPGDGGTLNDVTVPADSWIMMKITAVTACTQLNVTFRYTID